MTNMTNMEDLQEIIINEIKKQLKSGNKNISLLETLNRLLDTVSAYLSNNST